MFVTKRNGFREEVLFDKITERVKKLINLFPSEVDEEKFINATLVGQKVVAFIHSGITTEELERRVINISHILNQLEEHKNLLNHYKNEYSHILKKKCVHDWKPDYSDSQENRTEFYCQKCNIYKSDLLYNR